MREYGKLAGGKELPTTPFKVFYNIVEDGHEFTIHDCNLDCEFYIYKGSLDDPIFQYIVDTQDVHANPNGSLKIDLAGMLHDKVKELRQFAKENWREGIYISKDDREFTYDFLEDLVNVIHQGYYSYTQKVVNILKGETE